MKQFITILIFLVLSGSHLIGSEYIFSLTGENIRGEKFQKWLNTINTPAEISRHSDSYYYSFKSKGISLRFNSDDILTTVFLYSEGADGFRQFQGKLPFGLTFLDKRKDIEKLLGYPEKMGGNGVIKFWVGYPSKALGITYNTKNVNNLNAKIYTIYLK